MRTRFLNNDCFAFPPSQRRETPSFLNLPVPQLPAPPPSAVQDHLRFDSSIHVSHHIDRLPIDAALSKFLSGVLPHRIDFEFQGSDAVVPSPNQHCSSSFRTGSVGNLNCQQEAELVFEENRAENLGILSYEADIEFPRESKRIAFSEKDEVLYERIQFETPELDAILENAYLVEKERMQLLSQTPDVENSLEMLKTEPSMQYPYEALESISFEDVISEYLTGKNAYSLEDNITVQHQPHSGQSIFHILEVDEGSLGIPTCLSIGENVHSYFDGIKPQNFDEKYLSITEGKEFLGSTKYNMMEFFLDDLVSKQSLVLPDMFSERDFIYMLETELVDGSTAVQGTSQVDSALLVNPVTFQEFLFLEEDFIQTFEAFYDTKVSNDLETRGWMFKKEFNFKNFDELIVSNEIALIDDTFKSLAVPVISDYKKIIPLTVIIGQLFSNLKTRPLSATDGIYLNWDLLEEDKCNCKISNYYQNISAKIDLNYADFERKSFDDERLVFDLFLSGDNIGGCDSKQSEELQKLLSDCTSLLDNQSEGFASSKRLEHGSSREGSREQLPDRNAERASLLFKSMSEISNLDYFLDPQKATARGNCSVAVESTNANESVTNQKLERLLNFYPVEQSYDVRSSKTAPEADNFVPLIPALRTEHGHRRMEPSPGSVIIVNTQNVAKEMIVSRRSSYQVILAMEKSGIQVVERDLHLPVDIILSSAICLAWYDSKNLGKKATPATEASSSLPSCIENIATDVLTLLSFYFCGCFLVFEGEVNFLSTVMEFSDGLYAAAASLGIELQIFFSYSPELTNESIVSCIESATKLTRGLYPKMPDSPTLAESFLTEFPGINSLTAHSILSSGAMLKEFLEWSHEQRMHVLEKYNVPEESISLFSVFCRYGEREDSKSIMTDCSSSVSSGPDSDRCHLYRVDCERKRKSPVRNHQKDELYFDELLQFEPSNQVIAAFPASSALPKPCDLGMRKDAGRSSDLTKGSLSMSDFFGRNQRFSATTMRNPSRVSQPSYDQVNCKASQILEKVEQPCLALKNKELAQNDILGTAIMGKSLSWHSLSNSEKQHEDVRDEVLDLTDSCLLDKSFSISDSMYFPSLMTETEKDPVRKNKIARRLSFDKSNQPEANSLKIWRSLKDTRGEVDDYPAPDFGKDAFPLDFNHCENIFGEGLTQASMGNLQELPFQKEMSHLGRTPLSHARWSASSLKSSPWTTEFINRIQEKSKLRQKSLSCEKSAPYLGNPGNRSKVSKRRSPSVIELFKYQPSRTPGIISEQKRQKQSEQSSNLAKNGGYSASLSSWTPSDKISRKTLTFGRNESGSQTKLIWSDGNKLRYQA